MGVLEDCFCDGIGSACGVVLFWVFVRLFMVVCYRIIVVMLF